MTEPDEPSDPTVIAKLTAEVTGAASDSEGHLLDAVGNRISEEDKS